MVKQSHARVIHPGNLRHTDVGGGATTRPGQARMPEPEDRRPGKDLRCGCHRLLSRAVVSGIELRCPRCKTTQILTWATVHRLEAEVVGSV